MSPMKEHEEKRKEPRERLEEQRTGASLPVRGRDRMTGEPSALEQADRDLREAQTRIDEARQQLEPQGESENDAADPFDRIGETEKQRRERERER